MAVVEVVVVVVVVVGQTVWSISSRTLAYDCFCKLELCMTSMIATVVVVVVVLVVLVVGQTIRYIFNIKFGQQMLVNCEASMHGIDFARYNKL